MNVFVDFDETITDKDTTVVYSSLVAQAHEEELQRDKYLASWNEYVVEYYVSYKKRISRISEFCSASLPCSLMNFCENYGFDERKIMLDIYDKGFVKGIHKSKLNCDKNILPQQNTQEFFQKVKLNGGKIRVVR